jgi:hypothetical protein
VKEANEIMRNVGRTLSPLKLAAALAVVLVSGGASHAQLFTSGPFASTSNVPLTLTDWTDDIVFPKFDSNLGILQSVSITLTINIQTVITVQNTGNATSNGRASITVEATVRDPLGFLPGVPPPPSPPTPGDPGVNLADVTSPNFNFNLNPGQTLSSGTLSASSTDINSFSLNDYPAAVVQFSGNPGDTITLPAYTRTFTNISFTGGNAIASQITSAALSGNITYTYLAIPEPSALPLVGMGVLGLAVARRRARR